MTRGEITAAQRWLLRRASATLWSGAKAQLGAVPARRWGRWAATLALGFAACSLLTWIVTRVARAWVDHGLQAWDESALRALVQHAPMEFADAIMYESPGNLLYIAPLIVVALVIAIRRRHGLAGMSLLVGYLLQRPLVIFGWMWWDRARPDFIADGVASPAFHSFPSGHTAMATFTYGFLAYLWARSTPHLGERLLACALALGWITMIAVGRLRLGAHWPSDMIGGFVVALAWLAVVIVAHQHLERSAVPAHRS